MPAEATFEELHWTCATHNRAGRHEEALAVAQEAWRRFPERRHFSWWLVAYADVMLGRMSDAVAAIETAEEANHLWRIGMLRHRVLEPLRGDPRFAALLARAEARIAARAYRPRVIVTLPDPPDPDAPLLLGLHGATSTAEDFHPHWLPAAQLGCIVASVQSTQPATGDAFCWDDPDQARRDIATLLPELPPHGEVVFTGFSQGAAVALRLALAGDLLPAREVIGVGPSYPPSSPVSGAGQPLDVVILHGAEDRWKIGVPPTVEALRAAGHRVHVEEVAGLGHDYPADFAERLPRLLAAAGVRAS
jgi:dienelactone hydrolase